MSNHSFHPGADAGHQRMSGPPRMNGGPRPNQPPYGGQHPMMGMGMGGMGGMGGIGMGMGMGMNPNMNMGMGMGMGNMTNMGSMGNMGNMSNMGSMGNIGNMGNMGMNMARAPPGMFPMQQGMHGPNGQGNHPNSGPQFVNPSMMMNFNPMSGHGPPMVNPFMGNNGFMNGTSGSNHHQGQPQHFMPHPNMMGPGRGIPYGFVPSPRGFGPPPFTGANTFPNPPFRPMSPNTFMPHPGVSMNPMSMAMTMSPQGLLRGGLTHHNMPGNDQSIEADAQRVAREPPKLRELPPAVPVESSSAPAEVIEQKVTLDEKVSEKQAPPAVVKLRLYQPDNESGPHPKFPKRDGGFTFNAF
jgi:hypothetical protein